jgi:hypothetical protein
MEESARERKERDAHRERQMGSDFYAIKEFEQSTSRE